ncbi:Hms1 protein [Saccharomycopsis crataegensis]|uniref:Hms1 protein n=1 Tax=Saccharomycopsis crataegensis TaxID=43959 RepID=A0AAV5QN52_9ASCO|nr:Hms1 protein [Saccharomycopsis crataegensis]
MNFQTYTFDDANNLLSSLSNNGVDIDFFNDDDSKGASSLSPGSQLSPYSNIDEPWSAFTGEMDFQNTSGATDQKFMDENMVAKNEMGDFGISLNETTNDNLNSSPNNMDMVKMDPSSTDIAGLDNNTVFDGMQTSPQIRSHANSLNGSSSISPASEIVSSPEQEHKQEIKMEDFAGFATMKKESKKPSPAGKITKPKKGRASHNMVEKKYRTNINTKILALRDAVPSLRVTALGGTDSSSIDLDGLTPASKLNKASVLTKATEYIQHLEKKNKKLVKENEELRNILSQVGGRNVNDSGVTNDNNNNNNNDYKVQYPGNQSPNGQNLQAQYSPQFYNQMQHAPQVHHQSQPPMHQPSQPLPPQQQMPLPLSQPQEQQPQRIQHQLQQQPLPPHINYGMSMPMRMAAGGMAALVGTNIFAGNGMEDFRGLGAIPFLNTTQFLKFFQVVKIGLVLYSLFIILIDPYLRFDNKDKKKQSLADDEHTLTRAQSVSLLGANSFDTHVPRSPSTWGSLLFTILKIRLLKLQPLINDSDEIATVIQKVNQEYFSFDESKSKYDLLHIYLQLLKYNEEKDIQLNILQLLLSKVLMNVSPKFKFVKLLTKEKAVISRIQNLSEKSPQFKALVEDLEDTIKSHDLVQRLTNTFFIANRSINYNVNVGINEQSFVDILHDVVVNSNIISFARNLRANELLRRKIVVYITYLMSQKDGNNDNVKKPSLTRLEFLEELSMEFSIVNLRAKLFHSLLVPAKTLETMEIVQKLVDDINESDQLNGVTTSEITEDLEESEASDAVSEVDIKSIGEDKEEEEIEELSDVEEEWEQQQENNDFSDKEDSDSDTDYQSDEEEIMEKVSVTSESEYDEDEFDDEVSNKINLSSLLSIHNERSNEALNGEVFVALASSLILNYLALEEFKQAEGLLKHLLNYRNNYVLGSKKQITLLSFLSILCVLLKFDEIKLEGKHELSNKHSSYIENLIGNLRYWVGTESELTKNINDLDPGLKTEICDELVDLGVVFSGVEVDK